MSISMIERRNKLAHLLVTEGSVKVGELAQVFGVTTETIRKDLLYLQKKGLARKGHGGAVAPSKLIEQPFSSRSAENVDLKARIAEAAMELVPEGGVAVLDSGSTTFQIAKLLTLRKPLTIITNSLNIAQLFAGTGHKVFLAGGEMRDSSLAFVGPWAVGALKGIKADIAFMGTDGFWGHTGPCTSSYAELDIKRTILHCGKMSAVVCDSSKFGAEGMFQICEWRDVDCVITDSGAPKKELRDLERLTKLIVAEG